MGPRWGNATTQERKAIRAWEDIYIYSVYIYYLSIYIVCIYYVYECIEDHLHNIFVYIVYRWLEIT